MALLFSGAEPFVQFSEGHYQEEFCESILNLNQCFRRRCLLIIILIWSSGSPFVQQSETIYAILVEGIKRNNFVKLVCIWTSGSGAEFFLRYSLSGAMVALLFSGSEPFEPCYGISNNVV